MSINSALYTGISGLNTNGQAMTVIGNNLANTNTTAYKGSRAIFSDLLSANVTGSGGSSQVGRGVGLSRVDNVFSQGTFESTESELDLAIEGESFFMLSSEEEDITYYSRAGSFSFNDEGYMVNSESYRVQGLSYNDAGEIESGTPGDIVIDSSSLVAGKATDSLTLTTNLDSTSAVLDYVLADDGSYTLDVNGDKIPLSFDYENPNSFNYSSSVQIYDSLGNSHLLTSYFRKTDEGQWNAYYSTKTDDGTTLPADPNSQTPQTIYFGSDGQTIDPSTGETLTDAATLQTELLKWNNGSEDVAVTISLDTTQFNSDSIVVSQNQNGYGAGSFTGVSIDDSGNVIASYSNGEKDYVASISLAKFVNTLGLSMEGSNLFAETTASGAPRIGLPGSELGAIYTNSLEQSNVDMGAEFVKMITVQRGYQANSKIITTVDEMLDTLINLKR